jgi:hypothetical protein
MVLWLFAMERIKEGKFLHYFLSGKEFIVMREFVTLMYFRSRGGKVRSLKVSKKWFLHLNTH